MHPVVLSASVSWAILWTYLLALCLFEHCSGEGNIRGYVPCNEASLCLHYRDGRLMAKELCYLLSSYKQPPWIKTTVTFKGRIRIWTLYLDRVWMTQVNTAVKISGKYTSLIRSFATPSSGQNTVHEFSIWSLVRNVITYILQLLLRWLIGINIPRWGNLPGLNHSKLGWKKAKHFHISDLCSTRTESIMFFSPVNATDCSEPYFPMYWKPPQLLQKSRWAAEASKLWCPTCSTQNSGSTCPAKAIALLLLPRFLVRRMLNSQLIFFFPVSNYLTLYCCFYRHLNPCRETEPHKILYGSTMMTCSGISSEQHWLTKQQHTRTLPYIQEVFKVAHRINCVFFQLKLQWYD